MKRPLRRLRRKRKSKWGKKKGFTQAVQRVVNRNLEYKEATLQYLANATVNSTAGIYYFQINPVAGLEFTLGSSSRQRIGTEIFVKTIGLSFSSNINEGKMDGAIRVIWYIDHQFNAVIPVSPTAGDQSLLNGPNGDVLGANVSLQYNQDTVGKGKRYTILADKLIPHTNGFIDIYGGSRAGNMKVTKLTHTFPGRGLRVLMASTSVVGPAAVMKNQICAYFACTGSPSHSIFDDAINVHSVNMDTKYTDA